MTYSLDKMSEFINLGCLGRALQLEEKVNIPYSGLQGSDEKPGFFKYSIGFSRISFDWCVVRFRFFYERNDMIQGHLLDTSNMVIGCVKTFLERSVKQNHQIFWKIYLKKWVRNFPQKTRFWRWFCFSDRSKKFFYASNEHVWSI